MSSEESLTSSLARFETFEEKISEALRIMKEAISQEGAPRFREFWEVRQQVLPFFKEHLHPVARSKLWSEYVELTVEARRLKDILEEQSAFSVEQIELAIGSLEEDVKNFDTLLAQVGDFEVSQALNLMQRELSLLNTLASRLTGLRKEILKTDMRIRLKSKLFKRLSELGEQIFPKRKDLIDRVGHAFELEVEQFAQAHFVQGQIVGAPFYALKETIKALQHMGKMLTLGSSVFTRTRMKLSECWDLIRERQQKVALARQPLPADPKEGEHRKAEEEKFRLKRQQIEMLRETLARLLKEGEVMELDPLASSFEEVQRLLKGLELSKWERQQFDRQARSLKHLLSERKERALLNLSDDEKKVLENLRTVLEQKKQRRQEVKGQLELYRKTLGGSGLDFEKAMLYRELVDQERERLESADLAIAEIEEKIAARGE